MRCFIAVEFPDSIKGILYDLQKRIGNEYAKITWVAKKNLHLTLKFLGDVGDDKINLVQEALMEVKEKKFTVALDSVGWYPNDYRINVVWVGLQPEKDILNLHGAIELKLGSLSKKDERFSVHLTLGRVRFVKKREELLILLRNLSVKKEEFLVDHFSLIKSELHKDGPKYALLEEYPLV